MNVLFVSPSENLVQTVAEHLTGVQRDYSSNLVVFPGKRPSHFLRKALAEREGGSLVPPSVLSMDEFIDTLFNEAIEKMGGSPGRKIEAIDAIAILYAIHTASPEHLKWRFLTPDRFFSIGMKIFSDLEELHIERVPLNRVREIDGIAGEKIPLPAAGRLQSLSYFYEAFYGKMEKEGLSTRSSRYRAVAEGIEGLTPGFERIIFAGFFAYTESEKTIFRSLMGRRNTLFLFHEGEGIRGRLTELGVSLPNRRAAGKPRIHCYKSPDTHGQVFGVGALLKEKIDKKEGIDEKTVIVLPSAETLIPLFHQALSLLEPDDYNVSLGYPIRRTPLFGFFSNLMEVIATMDGDRLYLPHYLDFILHPYTKNIHFRGRADLTRILFHAIEEVLTEKKTKKFLSLEELESDEAVRSSLMETVLKVEPGVTLKMLEEHLEAIHANTIRKMLSFKDVGDFAGRLRDVTEYIYKNSTAPLHPFFYPYAESFVTYLDALSRSLMKEIRFQEVGSYFTLFKKFMMASYTPFPGTPLRGVQILGFLETRNLKFDSVLFLDANEGTLPDTTREDSFLPFKARQLLGLPTHLDREEIMSYYFDTLVRGAREVHLFYVENDQKERSRFVEKLLWEEQKAEGNKDDKDLLRTIQYAVSLKSDRRRPIEKSKEMVAFLKEYTFSATSLNAYLHCPVQFYFEYVLGLREREVVSEEFEKEEIGSFVHLALRDYFKEKTGRLLSERDLDLEAFEKIIRSCFEEKYGKDPTGEVYLLRRQIVRHLKDFMSDYQVPKIKEYPTRILALEKRIDVVRESFRLGAKLDRIEQRAGRTVILDYKTSANKQYLSIQYHKLDPGNRDSWEESIGSLQLPFYLLTYSESTGQRPENIDGIFLLLGKARIDSDIELPLFRDEAEFHANYGNLTHVIFSLLREIVDPTRPFAAAESKNRCGRCIYNHLCAS